MTEKKSKWFQWWMTNSHYKENQAIRTMGWSHYGPWNDPKINCPARWKKC